MALVELKEVSNQIADHTANGLAFTDNKGNQPVYLRMRRWFHCGRNGETAMGSYRCIYERDG